MKTYSPTPNKKSFMRPANAKGKQKFSLPRLSTISILVVYVLLFVMWEVFGHDISPYISSYPSAILKAASDMIASGELMRSLLDSLGVLLVALLLTFIIGIPVGYLIGRFSLLSAIFGPILSALFVTPKLTFVPLLVIWFGLNDTSRLAIVLVSAVFPVLYNVADGVRSLSSQYVDVARAYGASERQITWEVIFPGILPFIGAGTKQSLGRGLTGLIVAEFFIGATGLGGLLQETTNFYRFDKSFVIIFTLVLLGFLLTKLSEVLEDRLGRWKKSERAFN